ncbi:hypothetical protein BLL52_0257 [Rhodoferax antarcticus ANT.BR]|uniref:Uncharacterized protein n=1 Tax=Rhodoferax antarcticus ANT.BR TaxID=1111071 RepID=A0A1Q8YL24_9BURK|nr:hypothetical protein BLL52_0257 [Rhodoferax antarcticus ANT.BR]
MNEQLFDGPATLSGKCLQARAYAYEELWIPIQERQTKLISHKKNSFYESY